MHDEAFGRGGSKGSSKGRGMPVVVTVKGKGKGRTPKPAPMALTDQEQEDLAFSKLQSMSKLLADKGNVKIVFVLFDCVSICFVQSQVLNRYVCLQAWCCNNA